MKINSRNIISGAMIIAVFVSFLGINIGSHLCGMTGENKLSLFTTGSSYTENEFDFCVEEMPDIAGCSMIAEENNEEGSCCSEESGSHKDMFGFFSDGNCCLETTDFLVNSYDINLPVNYAGFNKIQSNVEFELPLNIQLNGIFETDRKHFKEIVYSPYCSNYLHFIQRMLL